MREPCAAAATKQIGRGMQSGVRLVVAITGSTGVIYGVRLLEALREAGVATDLILSEWGARCIPMETDRTESYVRSLADAVHSDSNMAAPVSSGTHRTGGMAVVPCSMKTLAAIACGYDSNLVARAAGVTLKEAGRRLVVVPREAPLSAIHLENMLRLARLGAVILPPAPAFYTRPRSIADIVDYTVGKCLDQFGIDHALYRRWGEKGGREEEGEHGAAGRPAPAGGRRGG